MKSIQGVSFVFGWEVGLVLSGHPLSVRFAFPLSPVATPLFNGKTLPDGVAVKFPNVADA